MAKQQGWKLEAVLNNDIVGGNLGAGQDAGVVRVFPKGCRQLRPTLKSSGSQARRRKRLDSREVARYIADVGRSYDAGVKPLLIFRLDRFLRGGDHYSFNQQGFAAVRFTEFRKTSTISIRTSAAKTASNMGTCRSLSTSSMWRT